MSLLTKFRADGREGRVEFNRGLGFKGPKIEMVWRFRECREQNPRKSPW
jgi:hypothetical protein